MSKNVENTMRKVFLYMTMTFDGFFSGPNGELDWMELPPDQELNAAKNPSTSKFKRQPGKDLGIPGGIRTAQTFARLGLIDEYILMVHPVAIGSGKGVITNRVNLELVSAKTYTSGVMRVCYRPRLQQLKERR